MRFRLLASACLFATLPTAAFAEDAAGSPAPDTRFDLGQIIVTGTPAQGISIGSNTVGQEAIEAFNRNTLDDAANLIPGVTAGNSGGSRNERLIFVRGFNRFQVPLSIDGIRVYLPADNRLDFGRFLTPDISEIQVAKGYASVLDGPGGMGGAINLVTRKPTKELDVELRGELDLGREGEYAGYTGFGLLGTKHDQWYAQVSFARSYQDHWDLPGGFTPTVNQNSGARDFSQTQDWRVNVKAGFTPNATDEYSINYTRQDGSKLAPLHITSTSPQVLRNWTWPDWNIESIYFLSTTAIGDTATLKTRIYRSNFYNLLRSFDDRTLSTQLLPKSFDSPYNDNATGGSAQLDFHLGAQDRLSVAAHFRRDEHNESQTSAPGRPGATAEPNQESLEDTWSVALENKYSLSPALSFTLGASYDWRHLIMAQDYSATHVPALFSYPLNDSSGWNGQGRLDWNGEDGTNLYASLSSRIRFPTLFERFSSQFGTAQPNPDLKPERATNLELGGGKQFGRFRLTGAVYYSWLNDALVTVRTAGNLNENVNIGSAQYYGGEIGLDADLAPNLQIGINYSYIHRSFDVGTAPPGGFIRLFRLTDVPDHKGFAYISWKPIKQITVLPSLEFSSERMTVTAATANGNAPVYYELPGYVNAAMRVDYDVNDNLTLGVGVRNLFDKYYTLTDGFPEPGRSFFLTARARY